MIRRPPRSTHCISSAASDVYKRQVSTQSTWELTKKSMKNMVHGQPTDAKPTGSATSLLRLKWTPEEWNKTTSGYRQNIPKWKRKMYFLKKYSVKMPNTFWLHLALQQEFVRRQSTKLARKVLKLDFYAQSPYSLSRKKPIAKLAKQVKGMLVVEMNAGQMVEDVKLAAGCAIPVVHFGRMGGIIPSPGEVVEALEQKLIGGQFMELADIINPNNLVYEKPKLLTENTMHYCPGCSHGVIHRLLAEVIEDMGIQDKTIGVSPVGCAVFAYNYLEIDWQDPCTLR
eukprot:TRINITY_DN23064_c0_g1_i2.p1 TRINITY_DN23064_c0_g1~~TRINITY_DN23064_c0_g1_i2.p1  ORF type:complete len:284 (+),score=32.73 TRINITY_DN23064_c0_g1_i2:99-950(+)